jgi:hypothetical protein
MELALSAAELDPVEEERISTTRENWKPVTDR